MVLHAFILNPRNFFADCIRSGKINLWATGMPWQAVTAAIDNGSFEYRPSEAAQKHFTSQTGHPWSNLEEPPFATMTCPKCRETYHPEWTTCTSAQHWSSSPVGEGGHGFADTDFKIRCTSCQLFIDHDYLRCMKFLLDVQDLKTKRVPMPGTFLSLDGR